MYKVIVWTPLRASADACWDAGTDAAEVASLLPWGVRWEVSDPEGLRRALSEGGDRTFRTRLRLPGRVIDLPLRVVETRRGLRCAVGPAEGGGWELRVRFERALGGRIRMVHELVLGEGGGRVAAELARWALLRLHRALAARLGGDAAPRGRCYVLSEAESGHGADLFRGA
jgi:hypothetical protein